MAGHDKDNQKKLSGCQFSFQLEEIRMKTLSSLSLSLCGGYGRMENHGGAIASQKLYDNKENERRGESLEIEPMRKPFIAKRIKCCGRDGHDPRSTILSTFYPQTAKHHAHFDFPILGAWHMQEPAFFNRPSLSGQSTQYHLQLNTKIPLPYFPVARLANHIRFIRHGLGDQSWWESNDKPISRRSYFFFQFSLLLSFKRMTKKNSSLSLAIFCLYEIDRFISRISFVCPRFRRLGVVEKSNEGFC